MSDERLYLWLKRQSEPSWMRAMCQKPSNNEDLKEGGSPPRVLAWIDELKREVEGVGPRIDEVVG
jgi:hypothetical protein